MHSRQFGQRVIVVAAACLAVVFAAAPRPTGASSGLPRPDHIVIVIEENHSFQEIYNSASAPFINSLVPEGALFTQSFAVEHPSEPNYLDLFSGSNQGVTDDSCPHSFSAPNLGAQLAAAGLSFGGYSEDLPAKGSTVCTSGYYARKHNPWVNFDSGSNAVAAGTNKPFAGYWPSTAAGFSAMPTVSIVVPNLIDDMHDGSISQGDAWFWNNLSAYYQWAQTHNSLLILTFDEDDSSATNQIFTLFLGPMVAPGLYANRINHFNVLRTIEDMYGLGYAGAAAAATPITVGWATSVPGPSTLSAQAGDGRVSLTWTAVGGAQSYNLYRGAFSNSETPLTSVSGGTSYVDTAVQNGTTYYYRITAVNANGEGSASNEASATPNAAPASGGSSPFGGTAALVPGTIEAENFDDGGASIAYFDTTAGNRGGAYRLQTDVDIESTSDAGGGYDVGWTRPGEWLQYTVNVAAGGQYDLTLRLASTGDSGVVHVEVDGINVTGPIGVPNTGGWQSWSTAPGGQLTLTAGTHWLRLAFDVNGSTGGVANVNWLQLASSTGSTPYGGVAATLPGTIEAENFDDGGESVAYVDTTPGNRGGEYRQTDVDIEITADTAGGYDVGWTRPGEWLQYTADVSPAGTYALELRLASASTGGTMRVEVDGTDVTGPIVVPNTGGWQVWQTTRIGGIVLQAGRHRIRLVFVASGTNGIANVNFFRFVP
jgi:hypothetical protein